MLINTNIVAKKDANGDYTYALSINGFIINIKFDPGAHDTVISANIFHPDISDDLADSITDKLNKIASIKSDTDGAPFKAKFVSASGDPMYGFLTDAGKVLLNGEELDHFYYYFIPHNNRPLALIGNNLLDYCEYHHLICEDVVITKIDVDKYQKHYINALSLDELTLIIDEVIQEENNDIDPMLKSDDPRWDGL